MRSPTDNDYCIGVAGAGAMGQGIVQVAAAAGCRVLLFDAAEGAAGKGRDAVARRLKRLAEKDKMTAGEAEAAAERIEVVDDPSGFAPCDAVVEAVIEKLEVKRELFGKIEDAVSDDCLIASNTSSIPIAQIAQGCRHRDRIAGLHFFNPVPLMKLVEVVRAAETTDAAVEAFQALGERLTRTPVVVKDRPGFLVNMGGRAYTNEALRILHEKVATPAQIDAIMRDCWGFPMGPFELMDLIGTDVEYPVSEIIWQGYQCDSRLEPRPNHKALCDAGLYGRKTGQGWYVYDGDGKPVDPPSPDHRTDAAPPDRVAIAIDELGDGDEDDGRQRLEAFCHEVGLAVGADDGACPVLASPVGIDASHSTLDTLADPRRLVCLDLLGDTSSRVTLMTPPGADASVRDSVAAAIAASGRKVTAITDSPGFVGPRMIAMLANLGCYMAEIGLAEPRDIDTAMKLGLNYPLGPLEFVDEIGAEILLDTLEGLHALTGEDRYRPTLWLRRRAVLELPAHTPA